MILVDTSVWIDHLRGRDPTLEQLLIQCQVYMHPMIIGELACGHLQNRRELLALWQHLPTLVEASHQEAMLLLEARNLMGEGIGYVDLHLLASCLLSVDAQLWTRDKRLARVAGSLDIEFEVSIQPQG